jgi:type VI protein secretion system component Hcp
MRSEYFRLSLSKAFLFLGLAVFLPKPSLGDIGVFLTYDGLPVGCGNSLEESYVGQITVRSFGQLLGHPTDSSGLPTGKSESRSIQIAKDMDKCSPMIFLDTLTERSIATMAVSFVTSSTERLTFAKVEATNVQIVNMNLDTASSGGSLAERLTFAIGGQLRVTFRKQNADGTLGSPVTGCWDFKQNAPC